MPNLSFYIVDVFAEKKYAGNQLSVFTGGEALTTEQMQRIAKEMNYSETTFILSPEPRAGGYDVRIFTPEQELPFAGHPTLGTAFILQQEVIQQPVETVVLNLKVGQIPVSVIYENQAPDVLWMRQNPPVFGQRLEVGAIAAVLNLNPSEIDARFPIEEVSTGVPFIIVPLKTLESLQRIKVDREAYYALIEPLQGKGILVFCPHARSAANQLSVRMFAEAMGVIEDPATGSANGCLAGYLVQHGYLGNQPLDVRVEQGYEIGRPSLLLLKAQRGEGAIASQFPEGVIEVNVGGQVVMVARGEFV